MDEYIKKETAIKSLLNDSPGQVSYSREDAADCIRYMDADDVAPVVRCKDCKYWQNNNGGYPHKECRWGHGETPEANDFCSYGEQKDGDGNG